MRFKRAALTEKDISCLLSPVPGSCGGIIRGVVVEGRARLRVSLERINTDDLTSPEVGVIIRAESSAAI